MNTKFNMYGGKQHPPIDVSNQEEMVIAGLHPKPLLINKTLFVKTNNERIILKRIKTNKQPSNITFTNKFPEKSSETPKSLIVYVKNDKKQKDFKTTHHFICKFGEIPYIIRDLSNSRLIITKMSFNKKEYV